MRIAFLGSPVDAVQPFQALVDAGHDVVLAVTQPDRKRGRGGSLAPTPVAARASELGVPITHEVDDVISSGAELGVVVAYGRLVRPHVLAAVPMVNLHFSLLPRWRGAAPVERAIMAGDEQTGVCLMQLEAGLDTGPVYDRLSVDIDPDETANHLRSRLTQLGTTMLIDRLAAGLGTPEPQTGEETYAAKISPDELHLDWTRPAVELHRIVRVGRAWTTFRGRRLLVRTSRVVDTGPAEPGTIEGLVVGCGGGSGLELVEVQPEGKGPQAAADWRNGARPSVDEQLGQ